MISFRVHALPIALACVVVSSVGAPGQSSFVLRQSLFDPSTSAQAGMELGYSVAVDGNLVVTGAPLDDGTASDSGAVRVHDATTGALLYSLSAEAAGISHLGWCVAISGTRVVAGVVDYGFGGPPSGSLVYVYDLASAQPTVPVLKLPHGALEFEYPVGAFVAISGTKVVIGDRRDGTGAEGAGKVVVHDIASATPATPIATIYNPAPGMDDFFGSAVAISGNLVVVGAPGDSNGATGAGSAYVFDLASATPGVPIATLGNPGPATYDWFGSSVGISGNWIIVGAHDDDTGAAGTGSAYAYDLASATPTVPKVTLNNPSPGFDDYFGISVAISGTRAFVGAYRDDTGAANTGRAYVYELTGATPTVPVTTLNNPNPGVDERFGWSVSLSGNRAVVGASWDDMGAPDTGNAYIYNLGGGTPATPITNLHIPRFGTGDSFGSAVALSGSRVLVGANRDSSGALNAGKAYLYDFSSPTPGVPILTFTNPTPVAYERFGIAVAFAGTRVIIGTPEDRVGTVEAGSAYVYDLAGANPAIPLFRLTNPTPLAFEAFGYTLAASGSRVVVGAHRDFVGGWEAGAAHVYDLAGPSPTVRILTLTNPSPASAENFGRTIAMSETRIVAGMPFQPAGGSRRGVAYVFDLATATPTVPVLTISNPGPVNLNYFGSAVAISGTRLAVGAPNDASGLSGNGLIYIFDLALPAPLTPVLVLTNPTPQPSESFGAALALSGPWLIAGTVRDIADGFTPGTAYVYDLAGATPQIPFATLNEPGPNPYTGFSQALAIGGAHVAIGAPFDDTGGADRGAAHVFTLRPALNIQRSAPGLATLSWTPTNSPGFVLQYTESLAPVNWSNAPSGAMNPVTISTTNAARFYRLAQP